MLPMPVVVTSPSKPPRRPAARPKPKKPLTGHTATAARLVDAWWEHQHPKPTNYMAVRSAVVACLEAGWAEDRIPQALDDVAASPYPVRAGTLETALKRRSNPARPAAGGNVHHLDRRAQNATAWAQEAAIAAGADPGDPFTTSNFFATTAADPNVIDGEIIRGTA